MHDPIIDSDRPVALLGGAPVSAAVWDDIIPRCGRVVAADSGARHALARGVMPDAVIGDMDSLSAADRARVPAGRLFEVGEQDSTDFDKALRAIRAPLVIGAGFSGARTDHQLAAFHGLVRRAEQPCILVGEGDITFVAPPDMAVDLPLGQWVSLFPLAVVRGQSDGLAWPIEGLTFAPDRKIGTSNMVTGPVRLRFQAPVMLVIMPRAALAEVVRSWLVGTARWSVPEAQHKAPPQR